MTENTTQKVCKELEKATILLKQIPKKEELVIMDIAIKELIKTRNTLDFIYKEQTTPTNWQQVLKAIK
jgi:hypothetical protein